MTAVNGIKKLNVAIVAGEASGDLLGAELIKVLARAVPDLNVVGIGGPLMIAAGCHSLFPMETLSVMGLVEVLGRLPAILKCRKQLYEYFSENKPDVFIGIDSPDFNLPLEKKLKSQGVLTIHYNSPTVWAWREKRLKNIAKSVDLMLTQFPFEAAFYEERQIPVRFVGHPLADLIPLEPDVAAARAELGIASDAKVVAILPGSRQSELKRLAKLFLDTANWCLERDPNLVFIAPMVNQKLHSEFSALLASQNYKLPLTILSGKSRVAMAASDVALLASGTATLEAMLLKKPMVVAYKLSPITYQIAKRMLKIDNYSLPNLLAEENLVPEFMQHAATIENLGSAILERLESKEISAKLKTAFTQIHHGLRRDAAYKVGDAVLRQVAKRNN